MPPFKAFLRRQSTLMTPDNAYAIKMCTLMALRYVDPDSDVKSFRMQCLKDASNFEHIVLQLEKLNGDKQTFCVQMKNFGESSREKPVRYTSFHKMRTKKSNVSFNLKNYADNVAKMNGFNKTEGHFRYVMFTNKDMDEYDERMLRCDKTEVDLINFGGEGFYFDEYKYPKEVEEEMDFDEEDDEEADVVYEEIDKEFLRKFLVMVRQPDEEEIKNIIKRVLSSVFQLEMVKYNDVVTKLYDHVTVWINNYCGGHRPLTKEETLFKIQEFVLKPYVTFYELLSTRCISWNEYIRNAKVLFVENVKSPDVYDQSLSYVFKNVHQLLQHYTSAVSWEDPLTADQMKEFCSKFGDADAKLELHKLWGNEKVAQITLAKVFWYLWKINVVPLVLRIEKESDLETLLEMSSMDSGRYVFLYTGCLITDSKVCKLFEKDAGKTIYDSLLHLPAAARNMIADQNMTFQGRQVQVKDILKLPDAKNHVYMLDVIQILLGKYSIGQRHFKLPPHYTHVPLSNILISSDLFKEQTVSIVFCKNRDDFYEYAQKHNIPSDRCCVLTKDVKSGHGSNKVECIFPPNFKMLINTDYDVKEINEGITRQRRYGVEYRVFFMDEGDLKMSDAECRIVKVVLSSRALLHSYLVDCGCVIDDYEIFEFGQIDLGDLPKFCKYVLATQEDLVKIAGAFSASIAFHMYKITNIEDRFYVEFLGSLGESCNVSAYAETLPTSELEYDFLNCFSCNNLNLIVGPPGSGKSVMLQHLIEICPSDFCTILVTFAKHSQYFLENDLQQNTEEHLKYFLSCNNICRLEQHLSLSQRICIFFDGFDELHPGLETKMIEFLKLLQSKRYTLFVTTRELKAKTLEAYLRTSHRTAVPFNRAMQTDYIVRYYKPKMPGKDEQIKEFVGYLLEMVERNMGKFDRDFCASPLQTMLVAEVYMAECTKFCSTGKSDVVYDYLDVFLLYEQFVTLKQQNLICLDQLDQPGALKHFQVLMEKSLEAHKMCAIKSFFSRSFPEVQWPFLINEIKIGNNKVGLIDQIVEDDVPIFVHRSIAEFMVGTYMSENLNKPFVKFLLCAICEFPVYDIIRQIFDRLLAKECPLHRALLDNDFSTFEELLGDKEELIKIDYGGRNILHLAMSWARRHYVPDLDTLEQLGSETHWRNFTESYRRIKARCLQGRGQEDFVKAVLKSTSSLIFKLDEVMHTSPLDYAVLVLGLDSVNLYLDNLCQMDSFFWIVDKNVRSICSYDANSAPFNYKQLLFVCCLLDYDNLALAIAKLKPPSINPIVAAFGCNKLSLVHLSAFSNCTKMVELLLKENVPISGSDEYFVYAPLHWAAAGGATETVKLLIDKEADLKVLDSSSLTPLYVALTNRQSEIANVLSEAENKLKGKATKVTKLFAASVGGDLQEVKLWLSSGEDPNKATTEGGTTLMMYAASKGDVNTLKVLIEFGANVNVTKDDNWTALMYASWKNRIDVVKLLLKSGADVHRVSKSGVTALSLATKCNNEDVIKLLKHAGAVK